MGFRPPRTMLSVRATLIATFVVLSAPFGTTLPVAATTRGPVTPDCFGREATVVGTTGNDQFPDAVFGTTADDVAHGLAGDDNVYALALDADPNTEAGDDLICAGAGSDDPVEGGGGEIASRVAADQTVSSVGTATTRFLAEMGSTRSNRTPGVTS